MEATHHYDIMLDFRDTAGLLLLLELLDRGQVVLGQELVL
jgi:hypothetical protein